MNATFKINKLDLASVKDTDIIVIAKNPDKKFQYAGGELEVDKSEVNVYLKDSKTGKASDISLNDFVKKVVVPADAIKMTFSLKSTLMQLKLILPLILK